MTNLRLSGVVRESIVDGPGIRMVIFSQGCPHKCDGCHNPDTHDVSGGYDSNIDNIIGAIKENPILQGVTFSGGEPFMQAGAFAKLAKKVHELGLNIITYTGYTIEALMQGAKSNPEWMELLRETDTLIDGLFVKSKKSLMIKFRGSTNQRIIDPRESIKRGFAVEKEI